MLAATINVDHLASQIRDALASVHDEAAVQRVRRCLESAIKMGGDFLPAKFRQPASDGYARRVVYADPGGSFTIMAMVWGPGQGTPLHDHDGLWVVECVYTGSIQVVNYDYSGVKDGLHQFAMDTVSVAEKGESDYRMPPFEHHEIANASDDIAITLHVFGGQMTHCAIFEPVDGGYRRIERSLTETP